MLSWERLSWEMLSWRLHDLSRLVTRSPDLNVLRPGLPKWNHQATWACEVDRK